MIRIGIQETVSYRYCYITKFEIIMLNIKYMMLYVLHKVLNNFSCLKYLFLTQRSKK